MIGCQDTFANLIGKELVKGWVKTWFGSCIGVEKVVATIVTWSRMGMGTGKDDIGEWDVGLLSDGFGYLVV